MKKFISICVTLLLGLGSMLAQENFKAVKGYVIDKNGNPIPGAEVMAPGGGESAITDSDGSFQMNVHPLLKKLSATYDGMTTKTLKIKPDKDLVFKLKKERTNPGFLNVVLGVSYNECAYYEAYDDVVKGDASASVGIMAGMLGKWGMYGKANVNLPTMDASATFGLIKSIYKRKAFIFGGLGFGYVRKAYRVRHHDVHNDYDYWLGDWTFSPGVAADFGFIIKTGRHFDITIGYNYIHSIDPSNNVHGLQLGLGYVF